MRKITGRKKSGPKKIGEVLPLLLARRGYADVQRSNALEQAWKSAAGIVLVRHSRVARIRGGVVEVIVRNSATLQELTFRKATLVREALKETGDWTGCRGKVGQGGSTPQERLASRSGQEL